MAALRFFAAAAASAAISASAEPSLRGESTEASFWPDSTAWGTCRAYGCEQPYKIGQLCGCWSGCHEWHLCCSDYKEVCDEHMEPSEAETFTFYIYRSQSNASYPPKNVNAANLKGVMWYLQNEVMTQHPPKFGISRILRYKIQTKAPQRLLDVGMDFGVRYAYDSQKCTGPGICDPMFSQYGYFVGCNNFSAMYPFPNMETHYDGGVWYSFPGEGACDTLTGADNCTYSYSWPPEEISLEELMKGNDDFWAQPEDAEANEGKVQAAAALFAQKYPDAPKLADPVCNFDYARFWGGNM